MSKIIAILTLIFFGTISFDVYAAQNTHVKHHLHVKKITEPVRTQEWYLNQARQSDRFKAIALENSDSKSSMVDNMVNQAMIPDHPIVETSGAINEDSSKVNFMFVPPFINRKLMDVQNSPNTYPTFTMKWKE